MTKSRKRNVRLGKRISYFRMEAGFTEAALAKTISRAYGIKVTEGYIHDAEIGNHRISAERLNQIADVLDVKMEQFF